MLKLDPEDRLGSGSAERSLSFDDLKAHPFFSGVNWNNMDTQDSPLVELYQRMRVPEQMVTDEDQPDSLFETPEYHDDVNQFTNMVDQALGLGQKLKAIPEAEYEGSVESLSVLRQNQELQKLRSAKDLDQKLASIEEEKKNTRNLSNVTDEEPQLKNKLQSDSSDTSSDDEISDDAQRRGTVSSRLCQSTQKVPMLKLSNEPQHEILLEGSIKKRSTLYIYRKRHMVLSLEGDKPKLVYYYASKKKVRNEIHLDRHTKAVLVENNRFDLFGDHEPLYFKEPGNHLSCKQWVTAINRAIEKYYC